jgi:hypothetical protein
MRRKGTVGREPPFREDLSAEDEGSSLLEAITRERLVKTTGWKRISGCYDL